MSQITLGVVEHEVQPPVGILLCTSKKDAAVRYALGGLEEQLFVSQYKLLLPDEAALQAFIERDRGLWIQFNRS